MKYIYYLFLILCLSWLGGFFHFIYGLSQVTPPSAEKTDGIVVLTGGRRRLQEAVRLLEGGMADKLFISGVNARVSEAKLQAVLGSSRELADCCIESGSMAQNTAGNAEEISLWVEKSHILSIRVVTSLEHMPRAMGELRHYMPAIRMIAHPVGQWRPENIRFISLAREYSKYLLSQIRINIFDNGA